MRKKGEQRNGPIPLGLPACLSEGVDCQSHRTPPFEVKHGEDPVLYNCMMIDDKQVAVSMDSLEEGLVDPPIFPNHLMGVCTSKRVLCGQIR